VALDLACKNAGVVKMHEAHLLDRGIYDVAEVARLVRRSVAEVSGWAVANSTGDALLLPRDRRLMSFYDLVTAVVVAELRQRGVPLHNIREARRHLGQRFPMDWPLAHVAGLNRLASVGRDVYVAEGNEWLDAGRGGQAAFKAVVTPLLKRLEFDTDGMAAIWRPARGVVVNPRVQAGAPCVEGTRLSTEFLADLAEAGEDPGDIARDYDIKPGVLTRALAYERALAA
jgi:uncharacterized protein (DUF433 family)